jgi:hypothetical protein
MPDYAQVAQQVYALYQAVLRDESRREHAAELLNYYPRLGCVRWHDSTQRASACWMSAVGWGCS